MSLVLFWYNATQNSVRCMIGAPRWCRNTDDTNIFFPNILLIGICGWNLAMRYAGWLENAEMDVQKDCVLHSVRHLLLLLYSGPVLLK